MSSEQERILALARDAWQATKPSDPESEFAAKRVERRLRAGRTRPSRRPAAVLAFVVVLVGGLAYAASGGTSSWFGDGARDGESTSLRGAVRGGLADVPTVLRSARQRSAKVGEASHALAQAEVTRADGALDEAGEPSPASQGPAKAGGAGSIPGSASASGFAPPAASWRAVDEALDARDDARAKKALANLAKSKDAATRAKARLGLAQLARSRGDCTEARRLAFEVITMPDVEPSVAKRARSIELGCQ